MRYENYNTEQKILEVLSHSSVMCSINTTEYLIFFRGEIIHTPTNF